MDEFNKNNIFDVLENNNKKDLITLIDMASDELVYEILQYDYNPKKCIAQGIIEEYYNKLN